MTEKAWTREAERLQRESEPIQEAARKLLENYRPGQPAGTQESVEVDGKVVSSSEQANEGRIAAEANQRLDQYLRQQRD